VSKIHKWQVMSSAFFPHFSRLQKNGALRGLPSSWAFPPQP
jgi:hypothetical protein